MKVGDEIICIKNKWYYTKKPITIGKTYRVTDIYCNKDVGNFFFIKNDDGSNSSYETKDKFFITKSEYRDRKVKELLS